MAQLIKWDETGKRFYETGVDRGVLYVMDENGAYPKGVAWNGLTGVTESPSGAEPVVLDSLTQMARRLFQRQRVSPDCVYEAVISGNTAMGHLLLGVPVDSLARAPYEAVFSSLPCLEARGVGLEIHPRGKVYFAPHIKSFVGGDISSGLLAAGLAARTGNFVFIDLGTNGEIVLKTGEEMVATSTAAGPAFEGMTISCGMPALPGAIFKAEDSGSLRTSTIGGGPARGVCGTGLRRGPRPRGGRPVGGRWPLP